MAADRSDILAERAAHNRACNEALGDMLDDLVLAGWSDDASLLRLAAEVNADVRARMDADVSGFRRWLGGVL